MSAGGGDPAVNVLECNPRVACRMRTDGHWERVHGSWDAAIDALKEVSE